MCAEIGDVQLFINGVWRAGRGGIRPVLDPATTSSARSRRSAAALESNAPRSAPGVAGHPGNAPAAAASASSRSRSSASETVPAARSVACTLPGGRDGSPGGEREVARAVETLEWSGEEAGRIEGRLIPGRVRGGTRMSVPTPLGVVAAFIAWNFPAVLSARKLRAALAAGCSVILKGAEETPRTAAAVVRALNDAGAPPGTVNLVFGEPACVSERLVPAPEVRAVTFTGSTRVGRELARLAAEGGPSAASSSSEATPQ